MIFIARMLQDIFTIVVSKAGQCLLHGQFVQPAECKDLAGAFVATCMIDNALAARAIGKAGRGVMVGVVYGRDDLCEGDCIGRGVDLVYEFFNGHDRVLLLNNAGLYVGRVRTQFQSNPVMPLVATNHSHPAAINSETSVTGIPVRANSRNEIVMP